MCMIKVDISQIQGFIPAGAVQAMESEAKEAIEKLEKGTGLGNDYIGWVNLASSISAEFIAEIDATAAVLKENC
ncbi:MAG: glucose-6-phosphate isomerase, partial [Bacteroidaceae bacterium]|nr:glucose-6-phosphate isomerase [Bacteroidaceae bacterium]